MVRPVTQNLWLESSSHDASQPVPMGTHNAVNLHVWVDVASSLLSDSVEVILQGSDDMDNWENISGYTLQFDQAPQSKQVPNYYPSQLSNAFVRVRFEGSSSASVVVNASLNLLTV